MKNSHKVIDKKLDKDLDRADDDGFAITENKLEEPSSGQDLDCWSDLWLRIKAQKSRFFKKK